MQFYSLISCKECIDDSMKHADIKKVHNNISYGLRPCISLTLFRDTSREYSRIVRQIKREDRERRRKCVWKTLEMSLTMAKRMQLKGRGAKASATFNGIDIVKVLIQWHSRLGTASGERGAREGEGKEKGQRP